MLEFAPFLVGDAIFTLLLLDLLILNVEHGLLEVEDDEIVGETLEPEELYDVEIGMFLLVDDESFLTPLVSDEDFRRNRTSGGTGFTDSYRLSLIEIIKVAKTT